MESRSGAVSSEQLAAIEDEEVLNKMVSRPLFGYFGSASVVRSLQAQVECGSSEVHAVEGRAAPDVSSNSSLNLNCIFENLKLLHQCLKT